MISAEQERYILHKAYVPEHIVSLMVLLSKGEPFLIEDYIYFKKDNWLIFIGYPLEQQFVTKDFEKNLNEVIQQFKPECTWFIVSEVPSSFARACRERESDQYYRVDLERVEIKKNLRRAVEKAYRELTVEREKEIGKEHEELIDEFIRREKLTPRVRELFLSMPEYIPRSDTAVVLNARDKKKNLSAFYIMELAAEKFATYVIGCHSKRNYVPYASDLLFFEMINLAREYEKKYINLGLGVNEGIRNFKEKWGGVPFLRYEFCEYSRKYPALHKFLRSLSFG